MKNWSFLLLFLVVAYFSAAQSDLASITIKTSSQCEMCKKRIEKGMRLQKGVKSAELNLENHTLTVVYNPRKSTPQKIKVALTKIGYDADDMLADPKAYNRLPDCCKKNNHKQ